MSLVGGVMAKQSFQYNGYQINQTAKKPSKFPRQLYLGKIPVWSHNLTPEGKSIKLVFPPPSINFFVWVLYARYLFWKREHAANGLPVHDSAAGCLNRGVA